MTFLNFLSKKNVLIALGVLSLALFLLIGYFRGHFEILDSKFFYMKSEIQPLFMSLGEEGRAAYMRVNLTDFCFIAAYTLFLFGMYAAFFKEMALSLIIIPTLLCFADLAETSIIFYLLRAFPESHGTAEAFLMFLTPAKWLLTLSSLLVVVNGYFVNLYIKKT